MTKALAFKKEKEHLLEAAEYVKERLTKMTAANAVQHDAFVSMQICLAAAIAKATGAKAEGREP